MSHYGRLERWTFHLQATYEPMAGKTICFNETFLRFRKIETQDVAKIRINKIDAARRQIDAAIRMTFANEDPVAIHTVIAAGHRIIRDICEQRGNVESYLRFTDWIVEGHERDFWSNMNASSNFMKHADKDANVIHEMDDELSDFMIAFASKWFKDLGNSPSVEMTVFIAWWALQRPQIINAKVLEEIRGAGFGDADAKIKTIKEALSGLDRKDRLRAGMLILQQTKNNRSLR